MDLTATPAGRINILFQLLWRPVLDGRGEISHYDSTGLTIDPGSMVRFLETGQLPISVGLASEDVCTKS